MAQNLTKLRAPKMKNTHKKKKKNLVMSWEKLDKTGGSVFHLDLCEVSIPYV